MSRDRHNRTVISDPVVLHVTGGKRIVDPPTKRRTWDNSRLVIMDDGSTVPVLILLANHVFGPWDTRKHRAVWKDKDYCNESPDNVMLVERGSFAEPKKNPYGFPAGTPEYWKAYRAANKAAIHERQRRSHAKRQEEVKNARALAEENARLRSMIPASAETPNKPETAAMLQDKLSDILGDQT